MHPTIWKQRGFLSHVHIRAMLWRELYRNRFKLNLGVIFLWITLYLSRGGGVGTFSMSDLFQSGQRRHKKQTLELEKGHFPCVVKYTSKDKHMRIINTDGLTANGPTLTYTSIDVHGHKATQKYTQTAWKHNASGSARADVQNSDHIESWIKL